MIAVLASTSTAADVVKVVGGRRCILAGDRGELLHLAGDANAVVFEAPEIQPAIGFLRDITLENPFLPVVLITEQGPDNLKALASVSVEAVLFRHEIVTRLPSALGMSVGIALRLRRMAAGCMKNEAIPAPSRRLLACALTSVPPPCTVQHLARLLNSDPSTIRRHWRCGVNAHGIQRVKDLLDWLVLVHAVSEKRPGLSWRIVAGGMGLHERTLRRLAVRLTGNTLSSVASAGADRLLERFAESLEETACAKLS